jgi:hypothetical protein
MATNDTEIKSSEQRFGVVALCDVFGIENERSDSLIAGAGFLREALE